MSPVEESALYSKSHNARKGFQKGSSPVPIELFLVPGRTLFDSRYNSFGFHVEGYPVGTAGRTLLGSR